MALVRGEEPTFVYNRLDSLVDVMMDVLSANLGRDGARLPSFNGFGAVLELRSLTFQTRGNVMVLAVIELAVLDTNEVVVVLLG